MTHLQRAVLPLANNTGNLAPEWFAQIQQQQDKRELNCVLASSSRLLVGGDATKRRTWDDVITLLFESSERQPWSSKIND